MNDIAEIAPENLGLTGFTLRDVPWGQLGSKLEPGTAVTAAKAAELGGLNFQVGMQPAGFYNPATRGWLRVPHRRAIVREDTQQFFGFVSGTYTPIQYAEAFAFMDTISPNYVAAGTLGGGRQGFLVVQLPSETAVNLELPGGTDPHSLYVLLRTSHDMSRALEVAVMMLRDRCMNAISLSRFTVGAAQRWSVKHVGSDPMAKLSEARETLRKTERYVEAFRDIATQLAEIDLAVEEAQQVLRTLLPDKPRREETVNKIVQAWNTPTNGFAGTGWGLTNAVSEFFEWGRPDGLRTAESRFTSGLTGPTHKYVNRAAQLVLRRR